MNMKSFGGGAVAVLSIMLLAACVDEEIVYRDRPLFEPPPNGAASFLGYSDEGRKLTVCGNCHAEVQKDWEKTPHASAWAALDETTVKDTCAGCHSVGALGNYVADSIAGYVGTKDSRYADVQCESCHGPGLPHVQNTGGVQPLAPLNVKLDMSTGCGECHRGAFAPFVEEWASSPHGAVPNQASPGGRAECQECHTGENALEAWGANANYAERDTVLNVAGKHLPITCGVCHDPHSANGAAQLRFPVDAPSEETNLCMKCHHKRGTPDPTTFRGPHSPEGPTLLGYGGWWPPNMDFPGDTIIATHGTARNPKLCAGCHVNSYDITLGGKVIGKTTGHLFNATPCVDANGAPTKDQNCALPQRSFRSCTSCHGTENTARALMVAAEADIERIAAQLAATLSRVQPNWRTCYNAGNCPAGSPFNYRDGKYTTAEGAVFNYELALYPGSVVHNPVLVKVLLLESIDQVLQDYNLGTASFSTRSYLQSLSKP
jgi:predicted CXXCH cytochrome family protein